KMVFSTEEEKAFSKLLKEQDDSVSMDLGYKVVNEQYVKGHFHHVGFVVEHDTHSLCIKCHGDVPHDKAKAIRAFLNMHAFYLSCEVCHIRPKEVRNEWLFRWYSKKTGELIPPPAGLTATDVEKYGNYGAKVAPGFMEGDKFRFINSEKERDFVDDYLKNKDKLSATQQSSMKKVIHRALDEQPLLCDNCHNEETPYLPFENIGYPRHRVDALVNTEVVGIAMRYKGFYMPKFLLPDMADINLPSFKDEKQAIESK
ncbi:MAG TPA: hypothetical protein VJL62_02405, partial [Thermodesulfobacteriota bacterium]|nr:hypothetical protein [Thermodesulfobacteriota bacterium]